MKQQPWQALCVSKNQNFQGQNFLNKIISVQDGEQVLHKGFLMCTKKNYEWIKCTWDWIPTDLVKSFKTCGISDILNECNNLVWGTDDGDDYDDINSDSSDSRREAYQSM